MEKNSRTKSAQMRSVAIPFWSMSNSPHCQQAPVLNQKKLLSLPIYVKYMHSITMNLWRQTLNMNLWRHILGVWKFYDLILHGILLYNSQSCLSSFQRSIQFINNIYVNLFIFAYIEPFYIATDFEDWLWVLTYGIRGHCNSFWRLVVGFTFREFVYNKKNGTINLDKI